MKRGTVLKLARDVVVGRALRGLVQVVNGKPITYLLKDYNGGKDPTAPHCADVHDGKPSADCIGFALHSSGIDRKQPGYKGSMGEWLNCASLLDDARGAQKFCRTLRTDEAAKPGDWLLNRKHIGVIVRPSPTPYLVVDCSPRHGRTTAIGLGGPWSLDCQVIRPLFYADV